MSNTLSPYQVLIVDDDLGQAEMMLEFLRLAGFQHLDHVDNIRALWERLRLHDYDVVLLDYKLPDGTGLDVLDQMAQRGHNTPVIMITGQGTERIAVQAIQRGAADYLLKSDGFVVTLPALIHKTVQAHQLKLSIQQSQEQVRYQALLLNNVRDAIVVWDLNGQITYWNPAAAGLYGWSEHERLGRAATRYYLSSFTPVVAPPREGEASTAYIQRQHQHPAGHTLWVGSRVTVLRDNEDPERVLGYMDVSHDITRSIEAEQALRESEARYRAIVEDYQTEMICRFKPSGLITFANEVFCRYFGHSREELVGMNFLYFIPDSERPRLIQHIQGFGRQRPVADLEHQVLLPEVGLRWIQRTDRAILDARGRIFEFQSVGRDITERKALEDQIQTIQSHLVQAARLATIGEVAAGVAHQIYNPLTTIIADAQLLLRSLPPGQTERESAEAIEQAGWRLQAVVQRLMEFSRPSSEVLTPLAINDTLHSAVALVSAGIEAAGGRLETNLAPDLPPVHGNARQLENLWINLLLLARDAVLAAKPEAQPCSVRVNTFRSGESHVTVEICDNGLPIPPDQLAGIFEPNFVGPTIGRGTGMELSICREIVRQHDGQITVESQTEHDTIFSVTFPLEVPDEPGSHPGN